MIRKIVFWLLILSAGSVWGQGTPVVRWLRANASTLTPITDSVKVPIYLKVGRRTDDPFPTYLKTFLAADSVGSNAHYIPVSGWLSVPIPTTTLQHAFAGEIYYTADTGTMGNNLVGQEISVNVPGRLVYNRITGGYGIYGLIINSKPTTTNGNGYMEGSRFTGLYIDLGDVSAGQVDSMRFDTTRAIHVPRHDFGTNDSGFYKYSFWGENNTYVGDTSIVRRQIIVGPNIASANWESGDMAWLNADTIRGIEVWTTTGVDVPIINSRGNTSETGMLRLYSDSAQVRILATVGGVFYQHGDSAFAASLPVYVTGYNSTNLTRHEVRSDTVAYRGKNLVTVLMPIDTPTVGQIFKVTGVATGTVTVAFEDDAGASSGTADTVIFNDGTTEYSSITNRLKVKEGAVVNIVREDSTSYDVLRFNVDTATTSTMYINENGDAVTASSQFDWNQSNHEDINQLTANDLIAGDVYVEANGGAPTLIFKPEGVAGGQIDSINYLYGWTPDTMRIYLNGTMPIVIGGIGTGGVIYQHGIAQKLKLSGDSVNGLAASGNILTGFLRAYIDSVVAEQVQAYKVKTDTLGPYSTDTLLIEGGAGNPTLLDTLDANNNDIININRAQGDSADFTTYINAPSLSGDTVTANVIKTNRLIPKDSSVVTIGPDDDTTFVEILSDTLRFENDTGDTLIWWLWGQSWVDRTMWDSLWNMFTLEAFTGVGGGGSSDTTIFNDGTTEYSTVANRIKVKEGAAINLVREDSTAYDVIRVHVDTTVAATRGFANVGRDSALSDIRDSIKATYATEYIGLTGGMLYWTTEPMRSVAKFLYNPFIIDTTSIAAYPDSLFRGAYLYRASDTTANNDSLFTVFRWQADAACSLLSIVWCGKTSSATAGTSSLDSTILYINVTKREGIATQLASTALDTITAALTGNAALAVSAGDLITVIFRHVIGNDATVDCKFAAITRKRR